MAKPNGLSRHYDKSRELLRIISYYLTNKEATIDDVAEYFHMDREKVMNFLCKENRIRELCPGTSTEKLINAIRAKKCNDPTYRYKVISSHKIDKNIPDQKEKGISK